MNNFKRTVFGLQHLLACFGATTLVPLLLGMDVAVALFAAGAGTLAFHFITEGKVPVFLGSSFAFIPVIASIIATTDSIPHAQSGIIAAGLVYVFISLMVGRYGIDVIKSIFQPHIMSTIIVIVGLSLVPVAFNMSMYFFPLALATFAIILIVMAFGEGTMRQMAILIGLSAGYVIGLALNYVDTTAIGAAPWFAVPNFTFPILYWPAILTMIPVVIAVFMEHLGDITANQQVVDKDFISDPGLNRTLMGDGVATVIAGFVGGPPNTTYSENTGVLAVTKVYDPVVLRIAAVMAIILAFSSKIGVVFSTIPVPVMGGASMMMFGMIAIIGAKGWYEHRVYATPYKLLTVVIMLFVGLQPFWSARYATIEFSGVALSAIVGLIMVGIQGLWRKFKKE